jgi:hypothetical protein
VPGGGGGRRLSGALGEDELDMEDVDDWIAKNLAPYINIATYNFLFIYIIVLISDLEDPFEYQLRGLLPKGNGEIGAEHEINPYLKGAADVDMYPVLECYLRLHSLTKEHAATGVKGIRGAHAPGKLPSETVLDDDAEHSTEKDLKGRKLFREALKEQLKTEIDWAETEHFSSVGGGGGDAQKAKPKAKERGGSLRIGGNIQEEGLVSLIEH